MTPEEGSAENSSPQSDATTAARRSSGRGRYSRGRRRPRRSSNQPRRLPVSSDVPPESDSATEPKRERLREAERPREPLPPPFQPAKVESIQGAIEKVTEIIGDLRDVLNDMELALEYLEDAERQQIADEREIENLQQRLNSMHRRTDRYQTQQRPPQRPPEERPDPEDAD